MCSPRCMFCILQPACFVRGVFTCLLTMFTVIPSIAEPAISASLRPENPKSGIPFHVEYRVVWNGAPNGFAIIPSDPAPVAWGTSRLISAHSETSADRQTITYSVEFVADRPGAYEIPAFKLSYVTGADVFTPPVEYTPATTAHAAHSNANDQTKPEAELETTPIEAAPINVRVGYYFAPELIAGLAAGALALAIAGIAITLRVRRSRERHVNPLPGVPTVQSLLNLARQHRLDGKFYDYYRALAQAATLAAPNHAARKLREKLEADAQRVGYGALQPSEDELEGALRDLERVLREPAATRSEG